MKDKTQKDKTKKMPLKKKLVIIAIIFVVVTILNIWGFMLKVETYKVKSDKIKNGLKIVFISDLHNCFFGGTDQSDLKDEIEKAEPDLVIFGGDVLDMSGGTKHAVTIMEWAAEKYQCFYVPGNHEDMRDDKYDFIKKVQSMGVIVLPAGYVDLTVKDQPIRLCGVTDYFSGLEAFRGNLDDSHYNILIAHQPEEIDKMLDVGEGKFDLILSGHAHAGQWRIPKLLDQGLYAPDQGLFPKYTHGMYDYENGKTVHIISRGLAKPLRMIFIPRIFNRPELSVIEISDK